jgi:hypothetical protein
MFERKPLLKHCHVVRLKRILNMLYKPSELAEEIGVTPDTIYRSYLPAGLPHTRDEQGDIWINGTAFKGWAKQTVTKRARKRNPLPDGYAWCFKCQAAVQQIEPIVKPHNRYLEILQAKCPKCGCMTNRARNTERRSRKVRGK